MKLLLLIVEASLGFLFFFEKPFDVVLIDVWQSGSIKYFFQSNKKYIYIDVFSDTNLLIYIGPFH